jgi:DNA mismatch endonuclease (patch repair protein)
MSGVRDRNTECELVLRRELSRLGLRYRLNVIRFRGQKLPGKPDLVFGRNRLIVFVDGDFWHGRILLTRGRSGLSAQFAANKRRHWVKKIAGNASRDRKHTLRLRRDGWRVIRVWESAVLENPKKIARRIKEALEHTVAP